MQDIFVPGLTSKDSMFVITGRAMNIELVGTTSFAQQNGGQQRRSSL